MAAYAEYSRLGARVADLEGALADSREKHEVTQRQWLVRHSEWDSERLHLRQHLEWFAALFNSEGRRAVTSEETVSASRRQITLLQQEGSSVITELALTRRSHVALEARNKPLEAAAEKLMTLSQLREEAKRARGAEKHMRAEVERHATAL